MIRLSLGLALLFIGMSSVVAQTSSTYSIPPCKATDSRNFVGSRIRFPVPSDAVVKKGFDVDYGWYDITPPKNNSNVLSIGYGPMWGGLSGVENLRKLLTHQVERTLVPDDKKIIGSGTDIKGRLKNGNYSRLFGFSWETIEYNDVSQEAAASFDSIIDNGCYQPPNSRYF